MDEDLQNFFCVKASERVRNIIENKKLSFFEIYPEKPMSFHGLFAEERTKRRSIPTLLTLQFKESMRTLNGQEPSGKENRYYRRVIFWGDNEEMWEIHP